MIKRLRLSFPASDQRARWPVVFSYPAGQRLANGAISTNGARLLLAAAALLLGVAVYALDRPAGQLTLISASLVELPGTALSFGRLGHNLPTFVHALAFGLLTAAVLDVRSKVGALTVCLVWGVVDAAFELGQAGTWAANWVEALPGLGTLPATQALQRYFAVGTYDVGDLVSIALGSLAALSVIIATNKEPSHE